MKIRQFSAEICVAGGKKLLRVLISTLLLFAAMLAMTQIAHADSVAVKYRGTIDLASYSCSWIERSSFINRVCFSNQRLSLVLLLKDTYYEYCRVPKNTYTELMDASSMGRYYNQSVKSHFDCRLQ
jgi:hypothetical protein